MKKEYLEPEMGICEINAQAVICYSNESPGDIPGTSEELTNPAPRRAL